MSKFYSLFKKDYMFYLILGLLVFIPVYPKFPLMNVPGTYVAIRLEDFLIALVVLVWFIKNFKNFKKLLKLTIVQVFLLFWAIGFLSLICGIFINHTVVPHIGFLHWARRVEYMILFFVAATSLSSLGQIKKVTLLIFGVTMLVVIYGFGQIFLGFPVISTTNKEFSKGLVLVLDAGARVNSTFAGHYDLAIFLSMALMYIAVLFFFYKKLILKGIFMIGGVLSFGLLGLTAARVSFVATIISLAGLFWLAKKRLLVVGLILAACCLVVAVPELRHRLVATVTVNLFGGGGPKYSPPPGTVSVFTPKNQITESSREALLQKAQLESTTSATESGVASDTVPGEPVNPTELGVYRSFGIRFDVSWPRAINAFLKDPILGTGYSSISLATDSGYLRSLGEVGLLGTFSMGLIFVLLLKRMFRFIKKHDGFEKLFVIASVSVISSILITATFIDVLEASKIAEILWLLLGIAWAVVVDYNFNDSEKKDVK